MGRAAIFQTVEFESYETSIPELLDKADASALFNPLPVIILKPNLVNASPFPVTTSAACCRAVVDYIKNCSDARIIIAEGCGAPELETSDAFSMLGYTQMASECDVELVDLNHEPSVKLENHANQIFPTIYLPELVLDHFLFSLPVLKAHSLAGITGTLKNMMGILPPKHYSGGSLWKKAVFHRQMQQSIIELNRYRIPDLTLLDARTGLCDYHLGGATCSPHVNRLIVSDDAYRTDRYAAQLLGLDPDQIRHIHQGET